MKKSGFSLMEMMVVLLIVAIIAAASAPMINKKLLSEVDTGSPWIWTSKKDVAWFNPKNNNAKTLVVGDVSLPDSSLKTRLFIKNSDNTPQLTLFDGTADNGYLKALWKNKSLLLSTNTDTVKSNAVAIGYDSRATSNYASAFGYGAKAKGITSVAIGSNAIANSNYGVAIGGAESESSVNYGLPLGAAYAGKQASAVGECARADGDRSVAVGVQSHAQNSYTTAIGSGATAKNSYTTAIGNCATANDSYSTAIGYNAKTTESNQIVLGTKDTTVYIPGNLKVGRSTYLGEEGGDISRTWIRAYNWSGNSNQWYEQILHNGKDAVWSDRRLKNVGEAFKGGLAEVKKLDVYNYTFKKDKNKTPMVGVMAQDLQKIFPNAVVKGDDGFLRIRMEDMFYALVNAVKELDRNITAVTKDVKTAVADIASLKAKTDNQAKEIIALQEQNKKLVKQNADFAKRLAALEKKVK